MTYQCVAKDGKSFRNTEFFTFDGDKIKRIDVYFGAAYEQRQVRQAIAMRYAAMARPGPLRQTRSPRAEIMLNRKNGAK